MKTEIRHYTTQDYGETDSEVVSGYLKNYYTGSGTRQEAAILGHTYKVLRRDKVTAFYDADGNTLFDVENERLAGEYSSMTSDIRGYTKTYAEFKAELDAELTKMSEGFVQIGYLLKVARDTNILAESGYSNVTDFAKAEYGIDKTQVSRIIRINDRFSEDGYSNRLRAEYQGYGYAKLILMLQLPDAVNEELSPNYSKSEIQAIKDEIDAENEVTDIERWLEEDHDKAKDQLQKEGQQAAVRNIEQNEICRVIAQLAEDEPELFVEIYECMKEDWKAEDVIELMAPQGEKTYSVRVPKMGRFLLMVKDTETVVQLINVRSGEKTSWNWEDVTGGWLQLMDFDKTAEERWSQLYGREFPKVAPVQPEKEPAKKTVKKPSKVTKAKKEPKPEEKKPETDRKPKESTNIEKENTDTAGQNAEPCGRDVQSAPDSGNQSAENGGFLQCEGTSEDEISGIVDTAGVFDNKGTGAGGNLPSADSMPDTEPEVVTGEVEDTVPEEKALCGTAQTAESFDAEADSHTEPDEQKLSTIKEIILEKIDKVKENVISKNWPQALMTLDDVQKMIKKADWMELKEKRMEWMERLEEDEE